jgi:ABC-type nitrate/sulfonate/bicarbonate transport system permease component
MAAMADAARIPITASGRRGPRFSLAGRATGFVVVLFLVGFWWGAAFLVARTSDRAQVLLPSPVDVVVAIPRLSVFAGPGVEQSYVTALRVIADNSLASAITLLGGLAIGGLTGIGMALALGWSPRLRCIFEGPLLVIRVIPLLALLPLFLSWFGGTQAGAICFVAFAVFSMLFVNALEAIRNVDPIVQVYARTLGASPFRVYRTVVMPAMLPELVGGLRVVLGLAWAILLAAEFLAAQSGVGRILILAQQYLDTSRMILIVILIMAYTYVLDRLVVVAGARVTRWVPRKGV